MKHIVIAGGGFAGIVAARTLAKHKDIQITLITDSETFRYCPSLYRVATGYRRRQAIIPIKELLPSGAHITIVTARVEKLDRTSKLITTDNGMQYHYDYAIFGLGVITSYFNIPGLDRYAYGIKSIPDLDRLHTHLHDQLTASHKPDTNYIIVGGGPTGVELAAGMTGYLKKIARQHKVSRRHINIEVVEAAPRLLPAFKPRASKLVYKRLARLGVKVNLDSKVEAETTKSLHVNGRSIPTHTVIWTAGVTTNPFYKQNPSQFELSPRGKVMVDEFLRVDAHTYVVGDNAEIAFSGLAEVAVMHGHFAAHDILKRIKRNTTSPFKPKRPIYVVPVGRHWALVQWNWLTFGGFVGGLLRKSADLLGYRDVMGLRRALTMLMQADIEQESCNYCQSRSATSSKIKPERA